MYGIRYKCDADCVGRTNQLLEERITQHDSGSIRRDRLDNLYKCAITFKSTNAEHLLKS